MLIKFPTGREITINLSIQGDFTNVLFVILQMMVDKNILNENEFIGYFAKAGFSIQQNQGAVPHAENCICVACREKRITH